MKKTKRWVLGYVGLSGVAFMGVGVVLWEPRIAGSYEVPSLTAWGKVFSVLLLGALGVAYLVWRRPIVQAQAILETSPLGASQPSIPLVDWALYFKTLLAIELLGLAGITVIRWAWRPLSGVDILGILTSGAIVALVVHLLILARSGGGRDS